MSKQPTMVTIQFPSKWIAEYFAEWVEDAFVEQMLGYEGQRLKEINSGGVDVVLDLVFVKDDEV
jgi:hypothetical protein